MTEWQPIETAPLDGECYIFADWRVSDGFQEVLFYDEEKKMLTHKDGDIYYRLEFFTHWTAELPPPNSVI